MVQNITFKLIHALKQCHTDKLGTSAFGGSRVRPYDLIDVMKFY